MKTSNLFLWIFSILLFATVTSVVRYEMKPDDSPELSIAAVSQEIDQISVINGHEFDLKLKNGERIHARLKDSTSPEAKEKVIRFINSCRKPRAKIYKKDGDVWVVDLFLVPTDSTTEISLHEWLKENKLLWK